MIACLAYAAPPAIVHTHKQTRTPRTTHTQIGTHIITHTHTHTNTHAHTHTHTHERTLKTHMHMHDNLFRQQHHVLLAACAWGLGLGARVRTMEGLLCFTSIFYFPAPMSCTAMHTQESGLGGGAVRNGRRPVLPTAAASPLEGMNATTGAGGVQGEVGSRSTFCMLSRMPILCAFLQCYEGKRGE